MASGLLDAAIGTPLMVAVHRYVILGEQGAAGAGRGLVGVYGRYFGWLVGFQVLGVPLVVVQALLPTPGPTGAIVVTGGAVVTVATGLVVMVPVLVAVVRLSMLLPAVAVGAERATLRAAWADGARHVWVMLLSILVASLGLVLGIMLVELAIAAAMPGARLGGGLPTALAGSISNVLVTVLGTAVTSQFYLVWARALKGVEPDRTPVL